MLLVGGKKSGASIVTPVRSPGYPSVPLGQAIEITEKIYNLVRKNPIDRDSAVRELGYTGLTGPSQKLLANLSHFGLIEKAGKGDIRVTELAVKILHPETIEEKRSALRQAAFTPELFSQIQESYSDGFVSELALKGFLKRREFSETAIPSAIKSYLETYELLQKDHAIESHGNQSTRPLSSQNRGQELIVAPPKEAANPSLEPNTQNVGVPIMSGERVLYSEEAGPAKYLKLIASGETDEDLIEGIESFLKRLKRRVAAAAVKKPDADDDYDL